MSKMKKTMQLKVIKYIGQDGSSPHKWLVGHKDKEYTLSSWKEVEMKEGLTYELEVEISEWDGKKQFMIVKDSEIKLAGKVPRRTTSETKKGPDIEKAIDLVDEKELEELEQKFIDRKKKPPVVEEPSDDDIAMLVEEENNSKIVPVKGKSEIFEISEGKDEIQIMNEIKGAVIKEYFYQFDVWNKNLKRYEKQTGIAYAGVKGIITRKGGIKILGNKEELLPTWDEKRGTWIALIKVLDTNNGLEGAGMATCTPNIKNKDFADRIAFSKALRNAWRSLLDETLIIKMAEEWLELNK